MKRITDNTAVYTKTDAEHMIEIGIATARTHYVKKLTERIEAIDALIREKNESRANIAYRVGKLDGYREAIGILSKGAWE